MWRLPQAGLTGLRVRQTGLARMGAAAATGDATGSMKNAAAPGAAAREGKTNTICFGTLRGVCVSAPSGPACGPDWTPSGSTGEG